MARELNPNDFEKTKANDRGNDCNKFLLIISGCQPQGKNRSSWKNVFEVFCLTHFNGLA
jgi:hypothetical protein